MNIALTLPKSGEYQIGGLCGDGCKVAFENCRVRVVIIIDGATPSGYSKIAGTVRTTDAWKRCDITAGGFRA